MSLLRHRPITQRHRRRRIGPPFGVRLGQGLACQTRLLRAVLPNRARPVCDAGMDGARIGRQPAGGDLGRRFEHMWADLAPIGRDPSTGGYRRSAWTAADAELRNWFAERADERGMPCAPDRNGNLWAWWDEPADGAVVTGSHLDS